MPKTSWKTTVGGVVLGLGLLLSQLGTLFDNDPNTTPNWEAIIGAVTSIGGAIGMGMTARDNDKTSADVGAGTK